jgi:hypothetical protein
MALGASVHQITWNSADAIGIKYPTSTAFPVKALVAFGSRGLSATGNAGDIKTSYGMGTDTTARFAVALEDRDGQATTLTTESVRNDCLVVGVHNQGHNGFLDINSMDNDAGGDGFTLIIDAAIGSNTTVYVLALGGDDITNAAVQIFQAAAGTGPQALTGAGFLPDLALFQWGGNTTINNSSTTAPGVIGFGAAKSSSNQLCFAQRSDDAVTTPNTEGIITTDRSLVYSDGAAGFTSSWSLVTMDATGLTLNKHEGTAQPQIGVLYLKGTFQSHVGTHTITSGATGNQAFTGVGFQGVAGLWGAHPEATALEGTTPAVHAEGAIGMATSSSARGAMWYGSEDKGGVANSVCKRRIETAKVFVNMSVADGTTAQGTADFVTWDADGYTWDRTTSFTNSIVVGRIILGSAAGAGGSGRLLGRERNHLIQRVGR